MRFLIDTNVVISGSPTRSEEFETFSPMAAALTRLAGAEHQLLIHPTLIEEIERDGDLDRRRLRLHAASTYATLEQPPRLQPGLVAILGEVPEQSHDWYDHHLLAAVLGNAVHGLVTQDAGIHAKARRLGIGDRVHTLADAVGMLTALALRPAEFVPNVEERPLHALDLSCDFFDSLRADYDEFDDWYQRVAQDGRRALAIEGPDGALAGICILKEGDSDLPLRCRVAKMCTMKVASEFKGSRYGELLLKSMFRHLAGRFDAVWVGVLPHHSELIDLLGQFGFELHDEVAGEGRYLKLLGPAQATVVPSDPLAYHIKLGPPAVLVTPGQSFIVPIQPHFHRALFPDAPGQQQQQLFDPRPHGNALRKAYLCHANTRQVRPGATLLFYRSHDEHAVTVVGVLESCLVSSDPSELLEFVSSRTVYSEPEVVGMAQHGDVLAMLFRQDRFLDPPIDLSELVSEQAVTRAPQTTIGIREGAEQWLRARLDA